MDNIKVRKSMIKKSKRTQTFSTMTETKEGKRKQNTNNNKKSNNKK